MIEKIKKHKVKIIVFIIVILLILLSMIFKRNDKVEEQTSSVNPSPVSQEIVNYEEYTDKPVDVFDEATGKFEIVSVSPGTDRTFLISPYISIGFRFNYPVNINSVKFNSIPYVQHEISYDEEHRIVYVFPVNGWVMNTKYAIDFSAESLSGQKMEKVFRMTFQPTDDTTGLEGLDDEHAESGEIF